MVSLWRKYKKLEPKKKQTLHSIFAGFICFALLYALTLFFDGSLCPVNKVLGVKCPGCGLTRGFVAILRFDFLAAIEYNVMSIPLFFGIFVYCALAIVDFVFNKSFVYALEAVLSKRFMYLIYFFLLIATYVYNLQK